MKVPSIKEQQSQIEYEQADLQCLESCMQQGFSINDWIMCKSNNIEFMKERLIIHLKAQQEQASNK